MTIIQNDQSIIQFSWVVDDLEEAAKRWHASMGIGPFIISRHIKITDGLYRGEPSSVDFSTAIVQAGPVQIELVQQHDDGPSCYRDTVPKGHEAMHHVAIIADDYDAAVAGYQAQGHAIASSGRFGGTRFCYIDCSDTLGHMVEILEDKPIIRSFFGAIVKAAEKWDRDTDALMIEF